MFLCSIQLFKSCICHAGKWKYNYCFPLIVKNNGKESLKLLKMRRENWLVPNFQEGFNREKA